METGYINLFRSTMKSIVYTDSRALHLWIHLLLKANYKEKKILINSRTHVIERGALYTSLSKLSDETKISRPKVNRLLKLFKSETMIETVQNTGKGTLISIINYEKYNGLKCGDETVSETIEFRKSSDKVQKKFTTNNNKHDNKEKNNIYHVHFDDIWMRYPRKEGRKMAEKHFIATVKTEDDFRDLKRAVNNYIEIVEGRSHSHIKTGATFFNNWRDYVNINPDDYEEKTSQDIAWEKMLGGLDGL